MGARDSCTAWVVYRMKTYTGEVTGNVVCEQREWDAIEAAHPGVHTILHAGLKTEQEAERRARGTSGDDYGNRVSKKRSFE